MSREPRRVDLGCPAEVEWIARTLESAGFQAWAVGGAVRDALSGNPPGDWDLTTSATPRQVQRIFRRTVPIGIEHGTVGVIGASGTMYEVTTFRRDVETDGRHARVAFSDDLGEDLARRDFTINAVAWHPLTHEVRDPHGGMADLQRGKLRTVGDPRFRFAEDRLRVLRGLRFAGTFDLRIEDGVWTAMAESSEALLALSPERVREELWKVFRSQRRPSKTLDLYARSGVLRTLYPELEATRGVEVEPPPGDLWGHLLECVDATTRTRPIVRVAALMHSVATTAGVPDIGADAAARASASAAIARTTLQCLRASNADTDRVTHLVAQHAPVPPADASDADLRRWIRRIGPDYLHDLFRLLIAITRASPHRSTRGPVLARLCRRTRAILRSRPPLAIRDLAISGADLRAAGMRPGPRFGEILSELLERVTEDPRLNERDRLLEEVRRIEGEG